MLLDELKSSTAAALASEGGLYITEQKAIIFLERWVFVVWNYS